VFFDIIFMLDMVEMHFGVGFGVLDAWTKTKLC